MKVLIFVALVAVALGRSVSTTWTLNELAAAIQDPNTDPALLPFLEAALDQWMQAIYAGQPVPDTISLPVQIPEIVSPEIVAPGAPASSPLVQIIINVQGQEVAPGPIVNPDLVVAPEPAPETVNIVDEAPETVNVVEQAPESPIVVELPDLDNPIDVIAINPPGVENPVDVIAINPPEVENPVDVIAINPPEVENPVDVIAINPPELNPIDVIAINPPELNPVDVIAVNPLHA